MKRNSELVLIDSEIIVAAPVRLFIAGIGDALATYFEARANDITETVNYIGKGYRRCKAGMAIAKMAYDLLLEDGVNAVSAVKRGIVTEEVENIIEANTLLSGLGFENTGCAAAHGIHSGITEIPESHKYLHGEKVAFGILCQMVIENTPSDEMGKILHFMKRVGLPLTLRGIGIEPKEENIRAIAHHTVMKNPLIHHEPTFITEDVVFNAIIAADEIGNTFEEENR
jgi:glycerol dehydrogenase